MGFLKEFRDFALRANVFDLAVGFVMGAAFTKLVTAFVDHVLMPPIGMAAGRTDFKSLSVVLSPEGPGKPAAELRYGAFLQAVVDFTLVAFAVFLVIKAVNNVFRRKPAEPAAPTPDQKLLMEIRDLLRARA